MLGLGLNVNLSAAALDAAIPGRPTTSMAIETGNVFDLQSVQSEILTALAQTLRELQAGGFAALASEWAAHDGLSGQMLRLALNETQTVEGNYAGVDELGRLCLTDTHGIRTSYWAGEVQKLLNG